MHLFLYAYMYGFSFLNAHDLYIAYSQFIKNVMMYWFMALVKY